MIKKLDWYTVKTFFGPFVLIFSILFFIFIIQFAWQEMDRFAGKGLSWFTIGKLLFFLGINVIQMVLPLSILLGSIMTFGGFGERYELAAMKASGISLARILLPVFSLVCLLSVGLYYFGDYMMPYSQRKAKNLAYNIVKTNPTLQLVEGSFIESIPGFSMKISELSGENKDQMKDVFIHQSGRSNEDIRTITANHGSLIRDPDDIRLLKMTLFDGHINVDQRSGKAHAEYVRQPNQSIQFDTLIQYIDVSDLMEKAMDEERVKGHYKFLNASALKDRIDSTGVENNKYFESTFQRILERNLLGAKGMDTVVLSKNEPSLIAPDELETLTKSQMAREAIVAVNTEINNYEWMGNELEYRYKLQNSQRMHYQRNYSYAFTCLVFFLIGAPLGAIVKKGGFGMPVVISIVIFVLYYIINYTAENMAKNLTMNPIFAAWIANLVFFPFSLLFLYKANHDSALFDFSLYRDPIVRFFNRFRSQKNVEHTRYQ